MNAEYLEKFFRNLMLGEKMNLGRMSSFEKLCCAFGEVTSA
ncbi:MAG: hypothetical protein ACTTHU_06020 [Treponema sp.]